MTDLRTLENDSIRAFVQSAADEGYLSGRVLDYGCGKQPYRDIVEAAGGEYHGYDRMEFGGNVSGEDVSFIGVSNWLWHFDAILCTQVVQYMEDVEHHLSHFHHNGGVLVLTYPTNWPEVEPEDLHRFTKAGMERLLTEAGFEIVKHEQRATFADSFPTPWSRRGELEALALGYGVVARA